MITGETQTSDRDKGREKDRGRRSGRQRTVMTFGLGAANQHEFTIRREGYVRTGYEEVMKIMIIRTKSTF